MTANRHRIQRQVLELTVPDAMAAPGIQEQVARACREPLLAGMTSVFDSVAPAHELLRLERLEIDVGRIEGDDWVPEFERRLLAELGKQLEGRAAEAKREEPAEVAGAGGGAFEAFLFFLCHGRLPWWSEAPGEDWSRAFGTADLRRIEALRAVMREEPHALARVIDALDDRQLETLAATSSSLRGCALALRELRPSDSAVLEHRWRRRFWMRVLAWSIAPGEAGGAALVNALMVERCNLAVEKSRQRPDASNQSTDDDLASFVRPVAVHALPAPWREWCETALSAAGHAGAVAPVADKPVKVPSDHVLQRGDPRGREVEPETGEAIYLPGAGILLLHPFLEALFLDRGLMEGKHFAGKEARQRAAQLLGYLATGRPGTPEYELGFAKLLTGIDLEAPVERAWVDERDMAACDELIDAVLAHWTALRSSSAAWLRSQFLLRDGKLEAVDGGWRVTVERRAQDVLMTHLPWGFGVIGLPWLEQRIFVRWLD